MSKNWRVKGECPICGRPMKTSGCIVTVNERYALCMNDGTGSPVGDGYMHALTKIGSRCTHGKTENIK